MMTIPHRVVPFVLASFALMGCRSDAPPDVVTRQYLEAGSRGDLEAARKLLVPRCHDKAEGRVEAIRLMGVPIKIDKLQLHITASSDTAATVRYEVMGSAKGEGESEVLGVKVKMDAVNVENATKGGDLRLEKVDGVWLVSCE
jgi:hypothetical protein